MKYRPDLTRKKMKMYEMMINNTILNKHHNSFVSAKFMLLTAFSIYFLKPSRLSYEPIFMYFVCFLLLLSNTINWGASFKYRSLCSFLSKSKIAVTSFPSMAFLYFNVNSYSKLFMFEYDSSALESTKSMIIDWSGF